MPKYTDVKKVLVLGSGPIVIGQAAEFDYAGTQACRALKEEGLEVVLVNSNPATIMTDKDIADHVYIEPLNIPSVTQVIEMERPDSILPTLGGQTGLNLAMALHENGTLEKYGVRLLGTSPESIRKAEDRQGFKDCMESINQPCVTSLVVESVEDAISFAESIGYPVIVRPAYTLGGTGGGIAYDRSSLEEISERGINLSRVGQVLIERCIAGWKEIEFEVMRDGAGNVITICSMENIDPVGVHTGDSIVVAPTQTLANREFQMLRSAALDIISALEIEGGCNVQFALNPGSFEYAVIEVNPRVSRSSALASKAVMKAIRSLELNVRALKLDKLEGLYTDEIEELLVNVTDERLFVVAEALRRGFSPQKIYSITKMDIWFLDAFKRIIDMEEELKRCKGEPDIDTLKRAKEMCFADSYIGALCGMAQADVKALRERYGIIPAFKMVDTCAAEFDAETPYYYSTYDGENEARDDGSGRKKVLVLGSGPIRIGQGIEFDYCSVHSVWALRKLGCETIIVNNNPETVSTDFDVADKLYFEPLTAEDVQNIVEQEKPWGAVVQFGGQTAIKLAKALTEMGVPILGTSSDGVDAAEDRERFDEILSKCSIPRAKGKTVFTTQEALDAAHELGYPVLVRPSYVLGGQGMEIAYTDRNIEEFMRIINMTVQEHPILVDKYLMGRELEVDGVFDGEDILIPGIMEHVERAGVHSGDSIAVYPPLHLEDKHRELILKHTKNMAKHLGVVGLINAQYILYDDDIYVIEVNPRSSRTIPYISKVTGVPIIDLATRVMLGEKLHDMEYGTGIYKEAEYYAVKAPVFSFEKLTDVDTGLGPEMKSTGEVLGLAETYPQALLKAFKGSGMRAPKKGGRIIITVKDEDKGEIIAIARGFEEMGVELFATAGTCQTLTDAGIQCKSVNRVSQAHPNILDMIASGTVDLIINTPTRGRKHDSDGFRIRRSAVEHGVGCVTSVDTARALLTVRQQSRSEDLTPIDITKI